MVHSSLQPQSDDNNSKFYMWRCIVTMAHADGLMHDNERKWLTTMFKNMHDRAGMPQAQVDTLLSDLSKPQDIASLLPQVSEPKFRGQLVYFARLLAYKDGELHPSEEMLLEKMRAGTAGNINIDDIREDVKRAAAQEMVTHDAAIDSLHPDKSPLGLIPLLDRFMLHFGIDMMDE